MMQLPIDRTQGEIKEGVIERGYYVDPVEGHSTLYTGIGRRMGPRRTYACATPPCWDSLYETVDTIIVSQIHLVPNSIFIGNYN